MPWRADIYSMVFHTVHWETLTQKKCPTLHSYTFWAFHAVPKLEFEMYGDPYCSVVYWETRQGRPCWWQTLCQIAPPICKKKISCDIWQVTGDMQYVTYGVGWTFSLNVRSLALTVYDQWCIKDLEEKDE